MPGIACRISTPLRQVSTSVACVEMSGSKNITALIFKQQLKKLITKSSWFLSILKYCTEQNI